MIIDELRVIQKQHGYLPKNELQALSKRTNTPLYRLHGVADFFPHFRLEPPPAVEVLVCADMSCHLNGADELRKAIEERVATLGPSGVVIREVSCLGQCDRAPAGAVNDAIIARLTTKLLSAHVEAAAAGQRLPHPEASAAPSSLNIDPYDGQRPYEAFRRGLVERDAERIIAELKASDLRGLGGAGFPTGLKWDIVRNAPSDEKYVVCNADESEPGTIKDRYIMEHLPHLLIEGIMLACLVVGATRGYIYIRHEYELQLEVLERELARCRETGLLGQNVLDSGVDLEISMFVSPGGYICGEESALLEAMEDKRAEPRNKPPFPGTHGLYNKPTVINNVETFTSVPLILIKGVANFKAQGSGVAPGIKFVGISGHVVRPGVYEIAMGTPARQVIFDLAGGVTDGRALKAFAPSGPSSGYLPASMVDVSLDFKTLAQAGSMLGSGAIVVCAEGTCMLDMALNSVRFFRNESCGKCVPCRIGSAKMVDILVGITQGRGRSEDVVLINELSEAMTQTSICGLGQVVPKPIESVLTHFGDEIETHLIHNRCPSGVCPMTS